MKFHVCQQESVFFTRFQFGCWTAWDTLPVRLEEVVFCAETAEQRKAWMSLSSLTCIGPASPCRRHMETCWKTQAQAAHEHERILADPSSLAFWMRESAHPRRQEEELVMISHVLVVSRSFWFSTPLSTCSCLVLCVFAQESAGRLALTATTTDCRRLLGVYKVTFTHQQLYIKLHQCIVWICRPRPQDSPKLSWTTKYQNIKIIQCEPLWNAHICTNTLT